MNSPGWVGVSVKVCDNAGRELAVLDAHVLGTPAAGDLQIGQLRESRD